MLIWGSIDASLPLGRKLRFIGFPLVFGDRKASAGLLEVMVAEESSTGPLQGSQIGAAVKKAMLLTEGKNSPLRRCEQGRPARLKAGALPTGNGAGRFR